MLLHALDDANRIRTKLRPIPRMINTAGVTASLQALDTATALSVDRNKSLVSGTPVGA